MKVNISYPKTGQQKVVEIDHDEKLLPFYEKRMSAEVAGDSLGDEFKGYIFKITGGNDKQGFPMKQGILCNNRVRLLFKTGMSCYRPRRKGERKRKSVRGCIVGPDLAVLNLVVVKEGDEKIVGLTDEAKPRRLGPKRSTKIRKLFNLSKEDNVCRYAVRRVIRSKEDVGDKKQKSKAPKIQRLVTKQRIQRKRLVRSFLRKKAIQGREDKKAYTEVLAKYHVEQKEKKLEAKKQASGRRASQKSVASVQK